MRYHNTHQPPNIYNENQASKTNPGHQGQIYSFGGQGGREEVGGGRMDGLGEGVSCRPD